MAAARHLFDNGSIRFAGLILVVAKYFFNFGGGAYRFDTGGGCIFSCTLVVVLCRFIAGGGQILLRLRWCPHAFPNSGSGFLLVTMVSCQSQRKQGLEERKPETQPSVEG